MPLQPADRSERILAVAQDSKSALIEMWRNNLRKSRPGVAAVAQSSSKEFSVNIVFDGGGLLLAATGMGGLFEITFPCRILGCHIYAGSFTQPALATATVDLRLAQRDNWASGGSALWTATIPTLTNAVEADVPITDWVTDLEPGDIIPYALLSITTSSATWLVVTLSMTRLDLSGTSLATIVDSQSETIITASGDEVILRS